MIWLKRIGYAILALLLVVAIIVIDFLRHGGQFKTLQAGFAGSCVALPLEASAEDIQIDRARGVAYLSWLDRRGLVEKRPVAGAIMLLDLNVPSPRPRPALNVTPEGFRPHGMSLYRAGDGNVRLFVINHQVLVAGSEPEEVIEIFEQGSNGGFDALRSVRDPLLHSPNAILAVGPNQFYVANDSGATSRFERATELLFRRGLSKIVYFDGQAMRVVATGLKSAAGIAMSPDGSRVYASETSGNRIAVFARTAASGELSLLGHVDIGSAPDNLNVNADGTVWIAAHAKVLALIRHFGDAASPAPTQILRMLPNQDVGALRAEPVYVNAGEQMSAGSVAAVLNNQMLIGSITERQVLQCRLP